MSFTINSKQEADEVEARNKMIREENAIERPKRFKEHKALLDKLKKEGKMKEYKALFRYCFG